MQAKRDRPLLTSLLRAVSRSFYLTLRILPRPLRRPIGLAYLLARATDTIADTDVLPVTDRLETLERMRARLLGKQAGSLELGSFGEQQEEMAERCLLERMDEACEILEGLAPLDRDLIRKVLQVITSGQELDLRRFAGADANHIIALESDEELEDYTYRVAGCVGEFWTRMCRARLYETASWDERWMLERGIRFGQGLQLVNILRDLPRDLRQGRCYLPRRRLWEHRLSPPDLLVPGNMSRFRPLYDEYLARAQADLAAGWAYTWALPSGSWRVRLGCVWPILIGHRTLNRLRQANVLDAAHRVKVTRGEVYWIMVSSLWRYPWPKARQTLFPEETACQSAGSPVMQNGERNANDT